jgi:chromosome partitioning protein
MPLPAEFLPLKGVRSFMHHFKALNKLNKNLQVLGFVLTRYDERKIMNRHISQLLNEEFAGRVFNTRIRTNMQLPKSQEAGLDVFSFDHRSHGAIDYLALAAEVAERLQMKSIESKEAALA